MNILLLIVIGFMAGIAAGMFGIGGGLIIVPALMLLAGFSQVQANGTSLAVLLLPVGVFAVWAYYRSQYINIKTALCIALGLTLGTLGGAQFALILPSLLLKQIYGVFLFAMGWRFADVLNLWREIVHKQPTQSENPLPFSHPSLPLYVTLPLGLLAGMASGLFGIGGGAVIVPILVGFCGYDQKSAIGTSLGALLLPVGLPGVLLYAKAGQLALMTALPLALGVLMGAVFGARITISLPPITVKRIYGFFLIVLAVKFIFF